MSKCIDCLHYEACKGTYYTAKGCDNIALYDFDGEMYSDSGCEDFSDRSEWVHLPCKVGSIVYRLNNIVDFDFCNECESFYKGGVSDFPCCEKTKNGFRHCKCVEIIERVADKDFICYFFDDFGKTVFLTREEAKKALEEMK